MKEINELKRLYTYTEIRCEQNFLLCKIKWLVFDNYSISSIIFLKRPTVLEWENHVPWFAIYKRNKNFKILTDHLAETGSEYYT